MSTDDKNGDFAMDYTHPDLDGNASYALRALNNAHIDEIDINNLNYNKCESILMSMNKPGVVHVRDGAITCVLTTEGQIALIRVENIFPLDTQGVEFSFAILK